MAILMEVAVFEMENVGIEFKLPGCLNGDFQILGVYKGGKRLSLYLVLIVAQNSTAGFTYFDKNTP
ncbi:hypothetical protein O71_17981 [Pontibacter sp. BAB1700]|nr:hypothetical protein O71_17981 [Pontibacter sp. BAB1700]